MQDSPTRSRSLPQTRPLIIAHRGASSLAPENTMAAFKRAMDDGADGIELDVRLSSDGVPVVIHDSNLRRVGLRKEQVSQLTASQLAGCDVGSWFNQRFPALSHDVYAAERVPTLDDFLTFIKGTSGVFYLEMKSDKGQGAVLARKVCERIRQHQIHDRVVVLSFDLNAVNAVKDVYPAVRTAALFQPRFLLAGSPLHPGTMVRSALACRADEIALHRLLVTPRLVQRAMRHGLKVVVWTVDNPAWMDSARRLGIHAVITNHPHEMTQRNTIPPI